MDHDGIESANKVLVRRRTHKPNQNLLPLGRPTSNPFRLSAAATPLRNPCGPLLCLDQPRESQQLRFWDKLRNCICSAVGCK